VKEVEEILVESRLKTRKKEVAIVKGDFDAKKPGLDDKLLSRKGDSG